MPETGAKKARSENRQKRFLAGVRMTEEDYRAIKALADREALSVPSYLLGRAFPEGKPTTRAIRRPVVAEAILSQLVAQLGKIGNNLNQIARGINRGESRTHEEIQTALAAHRQIVASVIDVLGRQAK